MSAYDDLAAHMRSCATLSSIGSILHWDQATMLPTAASAWRGEQHALIAELAHTRATDSKINDWLKACEDAGQSEGDSVEAANIRRIRRDYNLATKLPTQLVADSAAAESAAYSAWTSARQNNDFKAYQPYLERVLELQREVARSYETNHDLYDALFDQYEEGMTGDGFSAIMAPVIPQLSDLIQKQAQNERPTLGPGPFVAEHQRSTCWTLAQAMGFDGNRGRFDLTVHPFCTTLGPEDIRLTTRFQPDDLLEGLSTTFHEMGHGLYEQGLATDQFGLPCGNAVSLGIHESQSRLWENHIARSAAFGSWLLPQLRDAYGDAFEDISPEEYARRMHAVVPGFIRVEADEATYDLHIWLRFQLERALVRGEMQVADLPNAWNELFERLFGFKVDSDSHGCLQDVHWSSAFGYFPTYTLGNAYAAQLMATLRKELAVDDLVAAGDFAPILGWLHKNIHQHGRRYTPGQLCEQATGGELDAQHLVDHLQAAYG